jgi:hypothetical protein|tara:strand:- start:44 stop:463 length:420 start_codon:yes stop_codon:yes gene_type:complete
MSIFPKRSKPVFLLIFLLWFTGVVVPPVIFMQLRPQWLVDLDQPELQEDWDDFRNDMRAQSGQDFPLSGPVQRKVPKSKEPPIKVWLRDYAGLAVATWIIFGTVLFSFFTVMIVGLFSKNQLCCRNDSEKENHCDSEDT